MKSIKDKLDNMDKLTKQHWTVEFEGNNYEDRFEVECSKGELCVEISNYLINYSKRRKNVTEIYGEHFVLTKSEIKKINKKLWKIKN